jgi:hypothetical protein
MNHMSVGIPRYPPRLGHVENPNELEFEQGRFPRFEIDPFGLGLVLRAPGGSDLRLTDGKIKGFLAADIHRMRFNIGPLLRTARETVSRIVSCAVLQYQAGGDRLIRF